jgi:hypothetical protein
MGDRANSCLTLSAPIGPSDKGVLNMSFRELDAMRQGGFVGFRKPAELRASDCIDVPELPGVYLVVRDPSTPPCFVETSCGGRFKGRNPTVALAILQENWVPNTAVLYIGKAGGGTSKATLRQRLRGYMQFGAGRPVGHWGGRFIWQLQDCEDLLICWRAMPDCDAVAVEGDLIAEFAREHGKRPFANLRS